MNKIYLPNGMEAYQACYMESPILEYNNNPLSEALPPLCNREMIIRKLTVNPIFNEDERHLDSSIRLHLIQRLYNFFQPLPKHLQIWDMISTLIRQGYQARNPFDKDYIRYINETGKQIINRSFEINSKPDFKTTACAGTIIGFSGMGKSVSVNRVLGNIPQIICHNEYKGNNFNQIQLSYLKLEAPHNASLKALCLQFFMKLDSLLGTDNFRKYVSRNLSVDAMLPLMGKVAQNVSLGLLVLDELQHLNRTGNSLMNYFVTLINSFGVPIVFIGTPASYGLLENEFRIARRFTGSGDLIWNNMKSDDEFKLFLNGIWKYQWTKKPIQLTQELEDLIYSETQGISDLIVKLFVNAQYIAITTGQEEITAPIIKRVITEKFQLMKPMLDALRSGNPFKIAKYQDITAIDNKCSVEEKKMTKRNYVSNKKIEDVKKYADNNVERNEVEVKRKNKNWEYSKDDLRFLVKKGKEKELSEYEVLLEHDYIDSMSIWGAGDLS